jgi:transposase
MGKPYSLDLRKGVVATVLTGGLSCNQAAEQFGVAVSTAIGWVGGTARPAAAWRLARWSATG